MAKKQFLELGSLVKKVKVAEDAFKDLKKTSTEVSKKYTLILAE